ncbi:HEPN domain-containing protein [Desulfolutivibrio sulfoxidireducens]|uniref:HEPN domain-containing protein n=1 Tax=Desulfolutivibrio sulfoxidireducens TaxID=2773299 RepID=UPI00159D3A04|nr:HEPN domain-containing protein [Desulfolutivibrio sulfoxidireducens]QLA20147.1 hypothetical protein GD604_10675 [Desulfolutivibrio sulfoxidireducens]
MNATIVSNLYDEFNELLSFLKTQNEISFQVTIDDNFRKNLLLAAASFFENEISNHVRKFVKKTTNNNELVFLFLENTAIDRKYHTWFDWRSGSANSFFAKFGDDFKNFMKDKIKNDINISIAIKSFIEIGDQRNRLVHQNFAAYSLEKTAAEIYDLYVAAKPFVEHFPLYLQEFLNNRPTN